GIGETVASAGGVVFTGSTTSRSPSSYRSRLRRESWIPEIETEAQDVERQCLDDSMWMRCPPTTNEIELPAYADELSIISTARKQYRFIGASPVCGKARRG